MERKKSKSKGIRRLASVKNRTKTSVFDIVDLPIPGYEVEDALLSQLQVTDVLQNCVLGENPSSWSITGEFGGSTTIKRKQSLVYHRCYNDTTFIPLWHAFSVLDIQSTGQALLGKLMSIAKTLTPVLGDEQTDTALQKHFLNHSQVPFSHYQRYILDSTARRNIDAEKLCALCWAHCKKRYLNNPLVDGLDSVVPPDMCESLYFLFCIFNKLTEPGTYPPTMDHEETELLLRKLFACLGMSWSSFDEPHEPPIIEEGEKEVEEEQPTALHITFIQLLSIISDMVGNDIARTPSFHRAVQRLCLIEYQEVVKAGSLTMRKEENDSWKKRWGVLERKKLIFYDTALCQVMKEEVQLHANMQVESLPGTSSHKYRFRIVEKEGFNIIKELEFSASSSSSSHSWITLLNVSTKIQETGMSAKTAEICERRLERFKRRESMREVYKKKKDFQDTYRRLEEARKIRTDIMDRLLQRSRHRQAQLDHLEKISKVYEKLEAIQLQIRLISKKEREERMMKLLTKYEECVKKGKIIDDSLWKENHDSKALKELIFEKTRLENDLEELKSAAAVLSSNVASVHLRPPNRSASVEQNSYSSSENLSTTSNDVTQNTVPELTIEEY